MSLPARQRGWRDNFGTFSPALLISVFLATSTDVGLFPALVLGFTMTGVGWMAYVACVVGVCQLFWPKAAKDHADPFASKPTVTAAVLLSAFVWVWWQTDRQREMRQIVSCIENADDPDSAPAELARFCYAENRDDGRSE